MNADREQGDYLGDILDAIYKVDVFIKDMNYDQFKSDDKTIFAVIRALEIIGEATKRITENIRTSYPKIPWREMAGIRDKLIHDYFGVNIEVVWKTATGDLPSLKPGIKKILDQIYRDNN